MIKITKNMRETGIEFIYAETHADRSRIGIHLLNPDDQALWNAIEVADRDGFNTIVLHTDKTWYKSTYSLFEKTNMRKSLNNWISKFREYVGSDYILEKLEKTQDMQVTIESLTGKQLELVLKLVSASYSKGCSDTREHIKSLKESTNAL